METRDYVTPCTFVHAETNIDWIFPTLNRRKKKRMRCILDGHIDRLPSTSRTSGGVSDFEMIALQELGPVVDRKCVCAVFVLLV